MAFGSMRSSHIQHSSSSYSSSLFGILARFWFRFANHGLDIFYVIQHLSDQPCGFAIGQSLQPKMPWHLQKENRIGPNTHPSSPQRNTTYRPRHRNEIHTTPRFSNDLGNSMSAVAPAHQGSRCCGAAAHCRPWWRPSRCRRQWDAKSDTAGTRPLTANHTSSPPGMAGGHVVCTCEATMFNAKGPKA